MNANLNRWVQVALVGAILLLVNLLGQQFHFRVDLTREGRYSLSPLTERMLDTLRHPLSVKVYLGGEDVSPEVARFRESVRTFLEELRVQATEPLDYTFEDPGGNTDLQQQLARNGVPPIQEIQANNNTSTSMRLVFPAAVVNYNGRTEYIDLLKGERYSFNGKPNYLFAEQQLEYKFASALNRLLDPKRKVVGFLQGHREIPPLQVREWLEDLRKFYDLTPVYTYDGKAIPPPKSTLPAEVASQIKGEGVEVLIALAPDSAFTEREKYEIDQFVMRGGRLLILLDQQQLDRQSLVEKGKTLTTLRNLNLDDQFAKWGFRVNYNLIQDIACDKLYLVSGRDEQGRPRFEALPWVYYPRLMVFPQHPITQNLDAVMLRYAATIDTLALPGLRFTPLLRTSPNTRMLTGNVLIDLETFFRNPPPPEAFDKGSQTAGLLVEGPLQSAFVGRKAPTDDRAPEPPSTRFTPRTVRDARIIVLADGDIPLSHRMPYREAAIPYDNKTLLMNCVDYLAGDQAMNEIRAKDVRLRKLNLAVVDRLGSRLQALNVLLPVLLVLLGGALRFAWRRRRYGR